MERDEDAEGREQLEDTELFGPGLIHEMRHPLMGIKAGLELIARRLPDCAATEEWSMVTSQVARLEELFRGYQELFTPGPSVQSRFALVPVVQRAVDLVAYRLRPLGARFVWAPEGDDQVRGSPSAVLHAVVNLLVNAVDAVEERGEGRLELRVLAGPPEVRISDEGSGISAESAGRLFEPRFTTKAPGKGTGLGLHIARTAMVRSGGGVCVVAPGEPRRLGWARTEFAVGLAQDR
jgi:C4-dicarboxylate-specific signal transduction histidine kinase